MPNSLRFCPRCRNVMLPLKRGALVFLKCPKCGYEEDVGRPLVIAYDGAKPAAWRPKDSSPHSGRCPRCGHSLIYVSSHNLFFKYCASCGFISSEYRPPSYELPADPRSVEIWLEEERVVAKSNAKIIGYGELIGSKPVKGNPAVTEITLDVEVLSDETVSLRPYDSVYFGNVLGVVVGFHGGGDVGECESFNGSSCVKGFLVLQVESGRLPQRGRLKIAEPVMLYESALRILHNRPCTLHGLIAGVSPCGEAADAGNVGIPPYDLDEEKIAVIREIAGLKPWGYLPVEGPPGTGKTTVIAASSCALAAAGFKILITSHTNVAVDNALERIIDLCPELKNFVVRIGHPAKISPRLRGFLWDAKGVEELLALFRNKRIFGMTITKLAVFDLFYGLEQLAAGAVGRPLFDFVFIDEASMIPLGAALVPIHYSLRRVILGDTRQLPPIIRASRETIGSRSVLELVAGRYGARHLTIQRRGVDEIFRFISEVFYQGRLKMGGGAAVTPLKVEVHDDVDRIMAEGAPITWADVGGRMEWVEVKKGREVAYSALNLDEASLSVEIYSRLLKRGLRSEDLAIIATYKAQATLIMRAVERLGISKPPIAYLVNEVGGSGEGVLSEDGAEALLDLRVSNTVDSFQGREKKIVIYSIVADRNHKALYNYARFNVAISRAKERLVILSSLSDYHLIQLPWAHALARRSKRARINADGAVSDAVKAAVAGAYEELKRRQPPGKPRSTP